MRYTVIHEVPGRMRLRGGRYTFGREGSVSLEEYLAAVPYVHHVWANHKSGRILILFQKEYREHLLSLLKRIRIKNLTEQSACGLETKRTDEAFVRDLASLLFRRFVIRPLLPLPVRCIETILRACGYFRHGGSHLPAREAGHRGYERFGHRRGGGDCRVTLKRQARSCSCCGCRISWRTTQRNAPVMLLSTVLQSTLTASGSKPMTARCLSPLSGCPGRSGDRTNRNYDSG